MQRKSMFSEFEAQSLYCPKCKQTMPVRKRLLLVLPNGDKYEYLCSGCGGSLGMKMDNKSQNLNILINNKI